MIKDNFAAVFDWHTTTNGLQQGYISTRKKKEYRGAVHD